MPTLPPCSHPRHTPTPRTRAPHGGPTSVNRSGSMPMGKAATRVRLPLSSTPAQVGGGCRRAHEWWVQGRRSRRRRPRRTAAPLPPRPAAPRARPARAPRAMPAAAPPPPARTRGRALQAQDAGAGRHTVARIVVGVEPDQVGLEHCTGGRGRGEHEGFRGDGGGWSQAWSPIEHCTDGRGGSVRGLPRRWWRVVAGVGPDQAGLEHCRQGCRLGRPGARVSLGRSAAGQAWTRQLGRLPAPQARRAGGCRGVPRWMPRGSARAARRVGARPTAAGKHGSRQGAGTAAGVRAHPTAAAPLGRAGCGRSRRRGRACAGRTRPAGRPEEGQRDEACQRESGRGVCRKSPACGD